jgi:hypothetical protein
MNYKKLTEKKKILDKNRPFDKAIIKNLEEWFRIELTYSSNAIEGNTLSRAETALVVEKGLTIGGKSITEHLEATNQALFDSKQQNPYDKALTSPLLEEAKKAEQEQKSGDSWVKKLGLEDKAEKPRSFLEAAQAGKYGNIGSKGGAHEL